MARRIQLVEHVGAGMERRLYADGVRIRKDEWEMIHIHAIRFECFQTAARQIGTTFRRTNYSIAVLED